MSDEPVFPSPETKSPVPAAVVGALVHGGLWVLLFTGLGSALAEQRRLFDELHVQVPHATRWALNAGRILSAEPILAGMGLVALLAVDGFLLYRLGRGGYRLLREVWSGLMVLLPVAAFAAVTSAVALAHTKLTEAFTRPAFAHSQAEKTALDKLAGKWMVVTLERDGKTVDTPSNPADTLTISGHKFTWVRGGVEKNGTVQLVLNRNPVGIVFWYPNDPDAGTTQYGIFTFVGDRLLLCVGPPNALGEDIPADLETRGTKNERFTLQKIE